MTLQYACKHHMINHTIPQLTLDVAAFHRNCAPSLKAKCGKSLRTNKLPRQTTDSNCVNIVWRWETYWQTNIRIMWLAVRYPEHTHEIAPRKTWKLQQCSKNVTTQDMHLWVVDWSHSRTCSRLSVTVVKTKPCASKTSPAKSRLRTTRPTWKENDPTCCANGRSDSRFCHKFHVFIWWFCLLICQKDHAVFFKHFFFFLELHFLLLHRPRLGIFPSDSFSFFDVITKTVTSSNWSNIHSTSRQCCRVSSKKWKCPLMLGTLLRRNGFFSRVLGSHSCLFASRVLGLPCLTVVLPRMM